MGIKSLAIIIFLLPLAVQAQELMDVELAKIIDTNLFLSEDGG